MRFTDKPVFRNHACRQVYLGCEHLLATDMMMKGLYYLYNDIVTRRSRFFCVEFVSDPLDFI